ncbi:MAG: Hsp20/alpha crystallin family protein [Kiritimatiellae bacterium]|nr:Hsp20/alpha crystallin family protein [Kiritimatiellia bacterium]MDW8459507.1 Hsp20/alpha crystallin family protein [Verrucomicrobiota bacterium]
MPRALFLQWKQYVEQTRSQESRESIWSPNPPWAPNADVFEGPEGLVVRVEIAGVPPDSIELVVDDRALLVRGVRRELHAGQPTTGYRYRQMEIDFGPFERVIPLPFPVDGDRSRATMQQGMLTVTLPRAAARTAYAKIRLGTEP